MRYDLPRKRCLEATVECPTFATTATPSPHILAVSETVLVHRAYDLADCRTRVSGSDRCQKRDCLVDAHVGGMCPSAEASMDDAEACGVRPPAPGHSPSR